MEQLIAVTLGCVIGVFLVVLVTLYVLAKIWSDVIVRTREIEVSIFETQRMLRAIKSEGHSVKPPEETVADNEELREIIDSAIHRAEDAVSDLKHALLMVGKDDSDA